MSTESVIVDPSFKMFQTKIKWTRKRLNMEFT